MDDVTDMPEILRQILLNTFNLSIDPQTSLTNVSDPDLNGGYMAFRATDLIITNVSPY